MGDLYASAVGTTVLQLREVPPCPESLGGVLCLGDVPAAVGEREVRTALAPFGTVASVTMGLAPGAHVQMGTRAMAAAAVASSEARTSAPTPLSAVCGFAFIAYNERPYDDLRATRRPIAEGGGWVMEGDGRGWCVFEAGVSTEITVRLSSYPKMKTLLDAMRRPKALLLSRHAPPEPIEPDHDAGTDGQHVKEVEMRLDASTFTGRGDKPVVLSIYNDFVKRITSVLTQTLAFHTGGADQHGEWRATAPTITPPPAAPIMLAAGNFLLAPPIVATDAVEEARQQAVLAARGSDAPSGPILGVVVADGSLVAVVERRLLQTGFDACSQVVLPWRPPRPGWGRALLEVDLPILAELGELVRPVRVRGELTAAACYGVLKPLVAGLVQLQTPQLHAVARVEVEQLRNAPIHADHPPPDPKQYAGRQEDFDRANRSIATENATRAAAFGKMLDGMQQALNAALSSLFATECTIGLRNYGEGQPLSVYFEHEAAWCEAEVVAAHGDGAHTLRVQASRSGKAGATSRRGESIATCLVLHPWNHAPRELPVAMLDKMLEWHAATMRQQHSSIPDALSGKRLDVLDQLVPIGVASNGPPAAAVSDGLGQVNEVKALAAWLHAAYAERLTGSASERPACVLLTAGPAAGKVCTPHLPPATGKYHDSPPPSPPGATPLPALAHQPPAGSAI